jgi:hypothetical protein
MPAPAVTAVYPNDLTTGIPLRADIEITFDVGIDLTSAISNVVIYGPDFDRTSGPEQAIWIDKDTGENPYFLNSPGLTGTVPADYRVIYVDSLGVEADIDPVLNQASETAGPYSQKLIITPKAPLAADTNYTVYIIGTAEIGDDRGVSQRTIFDVDETGVTGTTGDLVPAGQFLGTVSDLVYAKITLAGDIGTAKYKWWFDSAGEPSAVIDRLTSRRFRRLTDGLQLRSTGSGFVLNDEYVFAVEPLTYLATSYSFSFTTGTGSIQSVPTSASTSIIGSITGLTAEDAALTILSSDPPDRDFNLPLATRTVTITFSEDLNPATITQDTVTVEAHSASGAFTGPSVTNTGQPVELFKKLTVAGAVLTIEI